MLFGLHFCIGLFWLRHFFDGLGLILDLLLDAAQDIRPIEDFSVICGDVGNASVMDGHFD
jgi:hypothetical protein